MRTQIERHLEAVGFEEASSALGVDARNREVLTYLPGVVARRPLPGFVTTDSTLASLARTAAPLPPRGRRLRGT